MKKYPARQSCKIILILVIWNVVNSMQALKTDEFCVDSFPLKSFQLEKQIVKQVISTVTKHILTIFLQLYISINKNSACYLCTTYLQCCIHCCLLVKNLPGLHRDIQSQRKHRWFLKRNFLAHCQLSKLFEISFLSSSFDLFLLKFSTAGVFWFYFFFPLNLSICAASLLLLPDHSRRRGLLLICFDTVHFGLYSF